ncbi:hypothetical protein ISF_07801 [Cordyceps fumosorosea ARSEF 2679]|uniref:Uncharacterized protein n=1 Tax=Cordyceps fumosorosea (strain ARSEF 2679) TaxID=1081104 RepID=A0A167NLS0_CORFA|nr:hypothetical protein ISF_07801 [Cordyceps fumosorosea ARSEF 2679]OAA55696.1 hypothetical protein ISF_07801 [Cordyceps fumosorosea ARSEF 2679]
MYGSAGFQALRVPSSRAPEAKDFVSAADYIVVWIYLDYLDLFEAIFEGHPESVWMARVSRVSIEYLSVAVVVLAAFLFSRRFLSQALLHFITRRVSWWHWLPENGGAKEFGPFWSVFLAMAVVMAPLALFTAAIAGVH